MSTTISTTSTPAAGAAAAAAATVEDAIVRWGIVGAANIAKKNVSAIRHAPNARVVAVASRSLERGRKFARAYLTPQELRSTRVYGSYDELLADPDVDAVYLPLPTSLHKEWATKVVAAGKHLLIEKPAALNLKDLQGITNACERAGLVFMDGLMFQHHARMHRLLQRVADPMFGRVSRITSGFSFFGDEAFRRTDIRCRPDGDPLGCLGDLGWYNARFALAVMGRAPDAVRCFFNDLAHGVVPMDLDATLLWYKADDDRGDDEDGEGGEGGGDGDGGAAAAAATPATPKRGPRVEKTAVFHNSFNEPVRQWVEVTAVATVPGAAHKTITMDDFVLPSDAYRVGFTERTNADFSDFNSVMTGRDSWHETRDCNQEVELFTTFSKLVVARRPGGGAGMTLLASHVP